MGVNNLTDWLEVALRLDRELAPSDLSTEAVRAAIFGLGAPLSAAHLRRLPPPQCAAELQVALYGLVGLGQPPGEKPEWRDFLVSHLIATRKGRPSILALAYGCIAESYGLALQWLDFPGHCLVRLVDQERTAGVDRSVLVDVADGASVDRRQLRELAESATGHADFDPGRLSPVPIARVMQRWLLEFRSQLRETHDWSRLLLVLTALVEHGDSTSAVFRDRARTFRELGAPLAARADFETYLERLPAALDRQDVEAELEQLREGQGSDRTLN